MSPIRFLLAEFTGIVGYLGLIALRRACPDACARLAASFNGLGRHADAVGLLVGARDVIRPHAPGIATQLQGCLDTSFREKP